MVKIGGGSITDQNKPRTAKREEISRLLSEIDRARRAAGLDVIIGHGSGSFGHVPAKEYRVAEGLINNDSIKGAVITKSVANELNSIVIEEAVKLGIPAFSFSPSCFSYAEGRKLTSGIVDHIKYALSRGFIPIVHGDVVFDLKQGVAIASTEEVFRFLSEKITPSEIILATDVDGIYDKDPVKYDDAKLIESVDSSNIDRVLFGAGEAHKIDVTGGMKAKVSLIYEMVKRTNALGRIVNATSKGVLEGAMMGKPVRQTIIKN